MKELLHEEKIHAWMNPANGIVIPANQKSQIGEGGGYPKFSVPLGKLADSAEVEAAKKDVLIEKAFNASLLKQRGDLQEEVEALRAENESLKAGPFSAVGVRIDKYESELAGLRQELEEDEALREKMSAILRATATALKGEPSPLSLHSWHDLAEVANVLRDTCLHHKSRHHYYQDKLAEVEGRLGEAHSLVEEIRLDEDGCCVSCGSPSLTKHTPACSIGPFLATPPAEPDRPQNDDGFDEAAFAPYAAHRKKEIDRATDIVKKACQDMIDAGLTPVIQLEPLAVRALPRGEKPAEPAPTTQKDWSIILGDYFQHERSGLTLVCKEIRRSVGDDMQQKFAFLVEPAQGEQG